MDNAAVAYEALPINMVTLKQIEALYWASRLRTFSAAAEKLHTTESAISKRIAELELFFSAQLFDRSRRNARLTPKGRELYDLAGEMLHMRDRMLEHMGKDSGTVRRFRIGVTELVALTWLPKLVRALQERYPNVLIEPEIDLSTSLSRKLDQGVLDLVIVPPVFRAIRCIAIPLDSMRLTWMCQPGLIPDAEPVPLDQIAGHPILMQIGSSGVDAVIDQWLREAGLQIDRVFAGNSLIALAALTVSGFGVSYLPALYFQDYVQQGALRAFESTEPLPQIRYHAVYRDDGTLSTFNSQVARICAEHCDFSKPPLATLAGARMHEVSASDRLK
jgi:DNA-binding transcriptional LysR family regulator